MADYYRVHKIILFEIINEIEIFLLLDKNKRLKCNMKCSALRRRMKKLIITVQIVYPASKVYINIFLCLTKTIVMK